MEASELEEIGRKLVRQEEALRHARDLTEHFITGNYDPHVKRWAKEILTAIEVGFIRCEDH
jgi:hypothetical protein